MTPQITLFDHVGNPLAYERPAYSSYSVPWSLSSGQVRQLYATGAARNLLQQAQFDRLIAFSAPLYVPPTTQEPRRSRRILFSQGETRPGFKHGQYWGYLDHVR